VLRSSVLSVGAAMMWARGVVGARPSTEEIVATWQEGLDFVSAQIANHPEVTGVGDPSSRRYMGLALAEDVLRGLMNGLAGWEAEAAVESGSAMVENYWASAAPASFCESRSLAVRREIRDLSEEEASTLFAALRVMGTVGGPEGRATYGERYVSFGELATVHAFGAVELPCDATHVFGQFLPWHRTWNTRVQQSVWAIEPDAPALPYHDFGRDVVDSGLESVAEWEVFSESMFGPFVGDRDDGFAVPGMFGEGPFPVPTEDDSPSVSDMRGTTPLGNAAGVLRSTWNPLSTPYVARLPPHAFGVDCLDTRFTATTKAVEALIHNASDAVEAHYLIEHPVGSPHVMPHMLMGSMIVPDSLGRVPGDEGYNATEVFGPMDGDVVSDDCLEPCTGLESDCEAYSEQTCATIEETSGCACPACTHCGSNSTEEFGPTWFADAPDIVKMATATAWTGLRRTEFGIGCIGESPCATPVDAVYDAACLAPVEPERCSVPPIVATVAALPGLASGISGDMNTVTADSDPYFIFHHVNVDRLYYEWQAKQVNEGLYPYDSTAGFDPVFTLAPAVCPTHGADHELVVMPDDHYYNWSTIFYGIYDIGSRGPTNRDAVVLANLDYTYDTVCQEAAVADDPVADDPGDADDPAIVDDEADGGGSSSSSKKSSKKNVGLVAGVSVAAALVLVLILAFICSFRGQDHSAAADAKEVYDTDSHKEADALVDDSEESKAR